jgi:hypothetical protein
LKKNSDWKEKVTNFIQKLKAKNVEVKFVRCDNTGEKNALEDHCMHIEMNVCFEWKF